MYSFPAPSSRFWPTTVEGDRGTGLHGSYKHAGQQNAPANSQDVS